ncbi:glycosyltransferase [Pedobacter sp. HMF7647]|uniref:Glycosyltransferase n=1 Tax=Hufsiella arboris TaxID=2695275 RepID=A0A7K1YCL3_9SPHI|nr:glycosyltransferase family 4 protein [Hufsiella arboris]MXV52121.1 glycosyltransferase [Hufsiella arboris]
MNVLMIARKTLNTSPGGDTVQINSTAEYLRKLNVNVDILFSGDKVDYSRYDLMHFFNIIRPDDIVDHVRKSGLPFVVSTIYVDYSEFEKRNRKGALKLVTNVFGADNLEYLKAIARVFINGYRLNSVYYLLNGHRSSIRYIATKSAALLPNSHSEFRRFNKQYSTGSTYFKIPNAIDVHTFDETVTPNEAFRNHVLCVGRIEGRKNQLNLIRAMAGTGIPLTIVGKPSPNHLSYFEECRVLAEKSDNVKIIEHMDHRELSAAYKAAKVHVLPSWFETTGLSSLEAAVMDCNIVVTRKGDTEEYFEDMAWYCEPDDISSIREQVTLAFEAPVSSRLKEKILSDYTWNKTAEKTLEAYKAVV